MLEGKVAIVTGAGRGLGRAEALELGRLGAAVVVNDLGGAADGSGADASPAQRVAGEIAAAGGKAIANRGDVADWGQAKGLIDQAVETFGGLDILVNNAGFLRDKMVFNMDEDDWDSVIRVHLKGHFSTSRWATSYWRDRSKEDGGPVYARIINTASEAFLVGSPAQPNYAAAKGGITAMTLSIAQSCARYGVRANVICPRARTRMTEVLGSMYAKPEEGFDVFVPENVAPLVGFLASPAAEQISGQVFIVYGGTVSLLAGPHREKDFQAEGRWRAEGLANTLCGHFEGRQPLAGYVMPYQ